MTIDTIFPLIPRPSWFDRAECKYLDTSLMFPERGATVKDAKATCMSCAVREECLEYALSNAEKFGVWGGKSERERRVMRHQRNISRQAS